MRASSFLFLYLPPHYPQFEFKNGYQQPMPLLTNYLAKPPRMLELLRLKPSKVRSRLPTTEKSWTTSICCGMTTFTSTIGQVLFQWQVSICHLGDHAKCHTFLVVVGSIVYTPTTCPSLCFISWWPCILFEIK